MQCTCRMSVIVIKYNVKFCLFKCVVLLLLINGYSLKAKTYSNDNNFVFMATLSIAV